jgi:hypothetical protein
MKKLTDSKDVQAVSAVPEEALRSLDEQIEQAGGELALPEEYEGSIGRTMFDMPSSDDGTATVLLPRQNLEEVPRQSLVRIKSMDKRSGLWSDRPTPAGRHGHRHP